MSVACACHGIHCSTVHLGFFLQIAHTHKIYFFIFYFRSFLHFFLFLPSYCVSTIKSIFNSTRISLCYFYSTLSLVHNCVLFLYF